MTQEQFNKAVEINNRIDELNEVKDEIKDTSKHRLWYAYRSIDTEWRLTSEYVMRHISSILDKYDLMIRKEIDEEIDRLKKEIEEL